MKRYELVFGKYIYDKLKKIEHKKDIKKLISKIFDKIEKKGPNAGKLIEIKLNLYEVKSKRPSLRVYFEIIFEGRKAEIHDFEIKKSKQKQQLLINAIKKRIFKRKLKP